jgi:hypothetical protein
MTDLLEGRVQGEEAEIVREALLEYCKLDTWAMFVVHREIARIAKEVGGVEGGGEEDDGLTSLTVEALKGLLRAKGENVGGRKRALIERLRGVGVDHLL